MKIRGGGTRISGNEVKAIVYTDIFFGTFWRLPDSFKKILYKTY
jgi:hypothetical protein